MKIQDLIREQERSPLEEFIYFWLSDSRRYPEKAMAAVDGIEGKVPARLRKADPTQRYRATTIPLANAIQLTKGQSTNTLIRKYSSWATLSGAKQFAMAERPNEAAVLYQKDISPDSVIINIAMASDNPLARFMQEIIVKSSKEMASIRPEDVVAISIIQENNPATIFFKNGQAQQPVRGYPLDHIK